ncbi:MAG: ribosome silencing factor [Chroococcidiopsidaceae cyanobacterium CP_BM_RX_35]|nr:ribosome silencing factor [Chroococcidiopsidaceae cyanobacterium CP_BM_RX_35]
MSDYSQTNLPSKSFLALAHQDASRELAITIAQAAEERKAGDIVLLRVAEVSYLSDYFVMMTGYSRVQVRALAGAIEDKVEREWQRRPIRTEGQVDGTWVLQDYGDVIAHIMMPKEREFYNLEAFWGHAEQIKFPTSSDNEGLTT